MSKATDFAMIVSGRMERVLGKNLKAFNVKLDMNQTLHIEAFSRKTGLNRSDVIRHFLEIAIEAVWDALDEDSRAEMNSIVEVAAKEILNEFK
jgi:signal transduction protein with GAF and PtsI domain